MFIPVPWMSHRRVNRRTLDQTTQRLQRQVNETKRGLQNVQALNDELSARSADMSDRLNGAEVENEQLKGRMRAANQELQRWGEESAHLDERLSKIKVLLASEIQRREEAEKDAERCKILLEEQTSCRLLGNGINIQGGCLTLPEIEAEIRQTLTITVSEWVEKANFALLDFFQSGWDLPLYLSGLFLLCKEMIDCSRNQYVAFFLGRVEGAIEANMEPSTAAFMLQHIRRHYITLFPHVGKSSHNTCRELLSTLGRKIAGHLGCDASPETITRALAASGLDKVAARYLNILVGCAVQHPSVRFSDDCMDTQLFNPTFHAEPIDGDSLGQQCKCAVVFPALFVKGIKDWEPLTKRFVLGIQEMQT